MSVAYRSTCRPTLGRYIDRDVSVNIASDISVDTSADMSVDMSTDTSRSTHRPRVGRYNDRHIGRASVDMSTDISTDMSVDILVEGFVNYTWSGNVVSFFIRKMHYPPETASVMLIAQMIATVLQVYWDCIRFCDCIRLLMSHFKLCVILVNTIPLLWRHKWYFSNHATVTFAYTAKM